MKPGHIAVIFFQVRDLLMKNQGGIAMDADMDDSDTRENQEWLLDCGASHHLTSSATNIENAQDYHGMTGVTVGNGSKLSTEKLGS